MRIQLSNTDKGKFTETPYEFISCISNNGTQIIIESNIDPNAQNLVYSYATVTEPVTANINILTEVLSCWVLEKSRVPKNENGDRYIQHFPDVTSTGCWGIISHDACPNVLQAVGNTLYFDGLPLGGGGGAITTVESGLYLFNPTTARLGGLMLEDVLIDGDTNWRIDISNVTNFVVNSLSTVGLNTNDGTHLGSNVMSSNLIRNRVEEIAIGNYSETTMTSTDISTVVADVNTVDTTSNLITPTAQLYTVTNGGGNNATIQFDATPSITLSTIDNNFSTTSNVILNYNNFNINAGLTLATQDVVSTPTLGDSTKNIFFINSNIAAITLVLPFDFNVIGRVIIVKDIGNNASVNNITVDPGIGNIEGAGSYVINTNRGSAMFAFDGTNWWLI